jgi:hypothetical protein
MKNTILYIVRFEVFTAVTMNNVIFWDVMPCAYVTVFLSTLLRLLVTANFVPSWPIVVTLMMEARLSSETSVPARAAWHNIPEDGNLQYYTD